MINIKLIKDGTKKFVRIYVRKTPSNKVLFTLSKLHNNNVYLKLESLQETGSFQIKRVYK